MTITRNQSIDQLEQATTEQLILLKSNVKNELKLCEEKGETQNQLQEFSFLAAPRDTDKAIAEDKKQAAELLAYVVSDPPIPSVNQPHNRRYCFFLIMRGTIRWKHRKLQPRTYQR